MQIARGGPLHETKLGELNFLMVENLVPRPYSFALLLSLTLPFSPQVLDTTMYISGGCNDPPRESRKKGTISGVPSRAGVMALRENIKLGAWPRLFLDSTRGRKYTGRASGCPCCGIPLQAPAQGSLRTLRAGQLRRADLQPYLGLANIVTDLVRGI